MVKPVHFLRIVFIAVIVIVLESSNAIASYADMLVDIYTVSGTYEDTLYGTVPVKFDTTIKGKTLNELQNVRVSVKIYDKQNKLIKENFYLNEFTKPENGYSDELPYFTLNTKMMDLGYGRDYTAHITVNKNGNIKTDVQQFDVKPSLTSLDNISLDISKEDGDVFRFEWSQIEGADGYVVYINDSDGIYFGNSENNNYCITTSDTFCTVDFGKPEMARKFTGSSSAFVYIASYSYQGYYKVIGHSKARKIDIDGIAADKASYLISEPVLCSGSVEESVDDSGFASEEQLYVSHNGTEQEVTLREIYINGDKLVGFSPKQKSYIIVLPGGTMAVPVISANSQGEGSTVYISTPESLPGTARIRLNSPDGNMTSEYELNLMVARGKSVLLGSLSLSEGILSPSFLPNISSYEVILPEGNTMPEITAVPSDENTSLEIIPANGIPGKALIKVKSEDGSIVTTYTVNFKLQDGWPFSIERILTVIAVVIAVFAAILSFIFYRKLKSLNTRFEDSD